MGSSRNFYTYAKIEKKSVNFLNGLLSCARVSLVPKRSESCSNNKIQSTETCKSDVQENSLSKSVKTLLEQSAIQEKDKESTSGVWTQPVYPETTNPKRSQAGKSYRPAVDPQETTVFLFPGQGSQFVGMEQDLLEYPNVEEIFKTASDILQYDLLHLIREGPMVELNKTVHCQPAVFVTSLATLEKLRSTNPKVYLQ